MTQITPGMLYYGSQFTWFMLYYVNARQYYEIAHDGFYNGIFMGSVGMMESWDGEATP